jgi:hypothetical protein
MQAQEKELQDESLRNQIALGWAMSMLVWTIIFAAKTVESILQDDNFRTLRVDPGRQGLKGIVFVAAVYLLMPAYVHLVHGSKSRLYRWIGVVVAVVGFLFFFLPHMMHWVHGWRPDISSHVLDVVLDLLSFWVMVNSVRWARFPRATP